MITVKTPSSGKNDTDFYKCPYVTVKAGFNIDKSFKSGLYRLVVFYRGEKSSGWKSHTRLLRGCKVSLRDKV